MRFSQLHLPQYLRKNLEDDGIDSLYPPQEAAVEKGVLEGESLVVATPTASGKTLIAVMAAAKHLQQGGRVLYLTPLRALAAEKLTEFKKYLRKGATKGRTVAITATSSDYDSSDPWLSRYDVVVATNEKADSLLRHGAGWIADVTLLVADEIHLLGDADRGPTLEMAITKMLELVPKAQLLCLSATIRNVEEIAEWLHATPITSDWRPVELKEGVVLGTDVEYDDGEGADLRSLVADPAMNVALNTVLEGGQSLVFTNTRKKAEAFSEKAASALARSEVTLTEKTTEALKIYSERILKSSDRTAFTEKLASVVSRGAAFHHAGLGYRQRTLVEEAFRRHLIKILAATPTLAAGVNLPARTVVIPDLWRYSSERGMHPISVLEYKQFCGRAGRPRYDEVGYAMPIAKRDAEKELLIKKYVRGKPEKIWSRLSDERHLRSHVLATVASGFASDVKHLVSFFENTFFAHQYGVGAIEGKVSSVLHFLSENEMLLLGDDLLQATKLGKRVSELYIDPLSAVYIIQGLRSKAKQMGEVSFLHLVCRTPDVPQVSMRRVGSETLELYCETYLDQLLVKPPSSFSDPFEYELYLEDFKKVMVLEAWINELSEGGLYERFRIEPGDVSALRRNAEWVTYSAHEIAGVIKAREKLRPLALMVERVRKGVKPELISLARLQEVGRVRARALYRAGYKSVNELKRASVEDLLKVPGIGPTVAVTIKKQAGGKVKKVSAELAEEDLEQSDLDRF